MFTEGLDDSAISWIKQGSEAEEPQIRSPLAEKFSCDPFPNSPLAYHSSNVLPPLKFRSGLLAPHSLVAPCLDDDDDEDDDYGDKESVASVHYGADGSYSEDEVLGPTDVEILEKPFVHNYDEEEIFGVKSTRTNFSGCKSSILSGGRAISRGLLKEDLRIEVPDNVRRYTDGGFGSKKCVQKNSTPAGCSTRLRERVLLRDLQGTSTCGQSTLRDSADLGTPSAPPIFDAGQEGEGLEVEEEQAPPEAEAEIDQTDNGVWKEQSPQRTESLERISTDITGQTKEKVPYWQTNPMENSFHYDTSGQLAWKSLVAYDACIRLCLQAWARGCTEAPEFLRDECQALRSAFGLHKFLLQPRGVRPVEGSTSKSVEQTCPPKAKKVLGKIRVEVKKLRVIPRRKLKSTYSQRGGIYIQAGAEYVRHVSSMVKSSIHSLKIPSLSMTCEETLSCIFRLKSATEDTQVEPGSSICLHPGSGEYHIFFPESQADALLVELQDAKKSIQGRATIPISALTDNPTDRIRWWPMYHDDQECVGKIQLSIGSTITSNETDLNIKSGPVVETLAYDLLLEAAMRAQYFHSRNLWLHGPWKWLLTEFADYYGVSNSYTGLRYLSHVMNVATPTKDCLELVYELLVPIRKARIEKALTRQEKSILLDCETQIESLLANVFENYKSLDESFPSGLTDLFVPVQETVAPALAPAVEVFTLLHDILALDSQNMLSNYLQTAAKKRCRKHMVETDEFVSGNSDGFLMDSITISTAYLKMKNLSVNISKEIQADIKIHNQNVLPSSIDLSNIAAAVYSTELCNRLREFLAAWPPSSPLPHVNDLLIATADFERDLGLWNISPVQGGVDSRNLFHDYIKLWIQDMELGLLELCKGEKVPWSGVTTNHSTSPFAEDMYEKIKDNLNEYGVVINRWPQYSLILETAVANVERAIIKAMEKQYNDILTPLKDSIPKRLNMHVQKLTRRQSTTIYSVPNQLGIFLNTIKRVLDVLHCRVEDILKSWASFLPVIGDKKSLFGEQMNGITVLWRTKYKTYLQATVGKLVNNMQASRSTRLKRILEEIKEEDGEAEVRERMQMLSAQLNESISNVHDVFTNRIFIAICRGFWDRMGQVVLKFLEGRKENRVWYNGSYYALGILDDTFASQMQKLQGNALEEKDLEPPRSVIEARSILCRDTTNATDPSTYFYV